MLTQTTETAYRVLISLALREDAEPVSPRELAARLNASPTYMAKITGLLVKANILRTRKGSQGGVSLAAAPGEITLLSIVEACQGKVLGDYCDGIGKAEDTCAYHQAMLELHDAITQTLMRWTVADLARKPGPSPVLQGKVNCKMACACRSASQRGGHPTRSSGEN